MKMPQCALVPFACLLGIAMAVAACGGDGGDEGEVPVPSPTTTEATPPPQANVTPEIDALMTRLADELGAERHFVRVGPVTYHYVQKGEGPVIIFVHGVPQFWWEWRHPIDALSAEMTVVAVDLKGFGASSKPVPGEPGSSYDVPDLAEEFMRFMNAAGFEEPVLVGHDWGGQVTWWVARAFPESISRHIIINSPLGNEELGPEDRERRPQLLAWANPGTLPALLANDGTEAVQQQFRERDPDFEVIPGDEAAFTRFVFTYLPFRPDTFTRDEIDTFNAVFEQPGQPEAVERYYVDAVANYGDSLPTRQEAPVDVPTLVLWGAESVQDPPDVFTPKLGGLVRDLDLRIIEESGHFVAEEQPDEVNAAILDYLRGEGILPP